MTLITKHKHTNAKLEKSEKMLYGETHMSFLDSWILLGLGNTAGAEILEGDVWGALKIEHAVAVP